MFEEVRVFRRQNGLPEQRWNLVVGDQDAPFQRILANDTPVGGVDGGNDIGTDVLKLFDLREIDRITQDHSQKPSEEDCQEYEYGIAQPEKRPSFRDQDTELAKGVQQHFLPTLHGFDWQTEVKVPPAIKPPERVPCYIKPG